MKSPDDNREEKEVFAAHLAEHGLKRSEQREAILEVFLRSERHLSVEELLALVQKARADVGRTTVDHGFELGYEYLFSWNLITGIYI